MRLEPTLSQSLHLLNGDTVGPKVVQGGLIAKMQQEKKTNSQIIETIYLRCLSRSPTNEERAKLEQLIAAGKDPRVALEDTFWAVLNSREFMFNH